jgi:hypothetical protein
MVVVGGDVVGIVIGIVEISDRKMENSGGPPSMSAT